MISAQRLVTIRVTTAIPRTSRTYVRIARFQGAGATREAGLSSIPRAVLESWDKFVSCTIDCQQVFGICRIRLQFLPQLQDLVIHGPRRWIGIIPPNLVEQNFARQHALSILSEKFQ